MSKPNYNPLLADMQDFLRGSETAEGGRVAMSLDMVSFLDTPIVYKYHDKDNTEYTDSFKVSDIVLDKPRNEDGSESKVVQGHRREALTAADRVGQVLLALRCERESASSAGPCRRTRPDT